MTEIKLHDEVNALLADLRLHLEWQREDGGTTLLADRAVVAASRPAPVPSSPVATPAQAPAQRSTPASKASAPAPARPLALESQGVPRPEYRHPFVQAAPTPAARAPAALQPAPIQQAERQTLDEIRRGLGDCSRCKLCKTRKNIVFGVGNPRAQLVFVGEAPGTEEDSHGVPFVGEAGQLLTKMIEAMGFSRDEVYLCNVVKCRPDNRKPEGDEVQACEPFLRAQLASIQPKVIVALGAFAAQTMLGDEEKISQLRGTWREFGGIPLMPTFHPAYLLKNPTHKKAAWSDLQQVMTVFGKQPRRGE